VNARFEAKVDRSGACHLWTGTLYASGYGCFWFEGKNRKAHRVAFFLKHGRWPTPNCLHSCDTPACCNDEHLFEGTHADNVADRDAKGRQRTPLGVGHGSAKLTEGKVARIRMLNASGVSQRELGRRFGISSRHASRIVNRENWKHV
jgi:hypothetical protein